MSKSTVPVPSKAAIRALRGLLFGTSCTFALVAEDRRRRINAASSVLRNADRIRSAKQYSNGGTALAVALEEEALLDPTLLGGWEKNKSIALRGSSQSHWVDKNGQVHLYIPSTKAKTAEPASNASPTMHGSERASLDVQRSKSRRERVLQTHIRPTSLELLPGKAATPSIPTTATISAKIRDTRPDVDTIASRIIHLADKGDAQSIGTALEMLRRTVRPRIVPTESEGRLLEASAHLCNVCQKLSLLEEAAETLGIILQGLQLDEDAYFSHDPLPLVEHLLPPLDHQGLDHELYVMRLSNAAALFLPNSAQPRKTYPPNLKQVGMELLERAFEIKCIKVAMEVFEKLVYRIDDSQEFLSWYLDRLQKLQQHKLIVKSFLYWSPDKTVSEHSFYTMGEIVVNAVELNPGYKVDRVLRRLLFQGQGVGCRLDSLWTVKLLFSHWQKHRNYEDLVQLFNKTLAEDISSKVVSPTSTYRVMAQIASEARDGVQTRAYIDAALAEDPDAAKDVRLRLPLALVQAQLGDWAGVQEIFEGVRHRGQVIDRAFIPILREYMRTHTIAETEAFMVFYIDNLKVGICRETVTLIANEYGDLRDAKSFVAWINYCATAGFVVDAAFSNAILRNCWKRWKFSFPDLRTLYRKLRSLSPNFEDQVTQRMMTHAALTGGKRGKKGASTRVASLGLKLDTSASVGHHSKEHALYVAMQDALVRQNPASAVKLYRHAVKPGMRRKGKCLKLAVMASIRPSAKDPRRFDTAIQLLKEAEANGEEVDDIAAHLLIAQLDAIDKEGQQDVLITVRSTLQRFRESGYRVSHKALNSAAWHVLNAGHVTEAITFALSAADAIVKKPGFNKWNFTVLARAYARKGDAQNLRQLIQNLAETDFRADEFCLGALKQARSLLRRFHHQDQVASEAMAVVVEGIRRIRQEKAELVREGTEVEASTLEIMRQAAVDAGQEAVEFDELALGEAKGKTFAKAPEPVVTVIDEDVWVHVEREVQLLQDARVHMARKMAASF